MKKVIRARTQDASPAEELVSPAPTPDPEPEQEVAETKYNIHAAPQPPLPNYPPPAESPPGPVRIKQERVDDEPPVLQPQPEEPRDKELCKDFVKGTCQRPVCRHSHNVKLHLDQLPRLFESCWTFQNTNNCTHPKCKFMHVSIFEQRKFYRTGDLPEHAFAHQRLQQQLQQQLQNDVSLGGQQQQQPQQQHPQHQGPPLVPPPHHTNGPLHPNHNPNAVQPNITDNQRGSVPVGVAPLIQCIPASSLAAFEAGVAGAGGVAAPATDDRPPASASLQRTECTHCATMKSQEQFYGRMVANKTAQVEVISKQQQDQDKKNMELLNVIMAVKQLTAVGGNLKQLKDLVIALRGGGGGGGAGRGD